MVAWQAATSPDSGARRSRATPGSTEITAGTLTRRRSRRPPSSRALRGREGWAFAGTAVALVLAVGTLFGDLWPNVLPSSTSPAYSLTVTNASSAHYTLVVMSWVAVIFTPVVLGYQGWTYWVFRNRLTSSDIPAAAQQASPPPLTRPGTAEQAGGRP
jgi:hypothetical protein